jgi:hypothetical protein
VASSISSVQQADGENKKPKRGRKPADESRARDIRARLVAWKQAPESQRVSLRTLAAELGTSHQLLAFYLRGLDEWQRKDYERRAEGIRERASAENRPMTSWEESQVKALERAAYLCLIDSVLQPTLKRLEADSKAGTLSKRELMVVGFLAQRGVPIAQKILQKHRSQTPRTDKATPRKVKRLDAALAELKWTTDSEKYLRLIRKLTPEEREELGVLQEKRAANGGGIPIGPTNG